MFFNILLPMRRCLLNIHSVSSGQIENSFVFTKNEKVLLTQISHSTSGPCWPYYCGAMVPLDISWQRFQYSRVWENAKELKKKMMANHILENANKYIANISRVFGVVVDAGILYLSTKSNICT